MLATTGHIVLPPIAPRNQKSLFKLHAIGFEDVRAAAPEIRKAQDYIEESFGSSSERRVGWVTITLCEESEEVYLCFGYWENEMLHLGMACKIPGQTYHFQNEELFAFLPDEQLVLAWEMQCFTKYVGHDDRSNAYINDVMQT